MRWLWLLLVRLLGIKLVVFAVVVGRILCGHHHYKENLRLVKTVEAFWNILGKSRVGRNIFGARSIFGNQPCGEREDNTHPQEQQQEYRFSHTSSSIRWSSAGGTNSVKSRSEPKDPKRNPVLEAGEEGKVEGKCWTPDTRFSFFFRTRPLSPSCVLILLTVPPPPESLLCEKGRTDQEREVRERANAGKKQFSSRLRSEKRLR